MTADIIGEGGRGVPQRRLELRGITKRFGPTVANDDADLHVSAGEVHALLGENGAGKSTLVKVAYGLLRPDSGEMRWEGKPVQLRGPKEARALGIGMVFQHFLLFDSMSVRENIALACTDTGRALDARIQKVSEAYGLKLDLGRTVANLSVGERQRIEIVRCLLEEPRLLIMDEPTSVLTPQEVDGLFATLRTLRDGGVSILYISHKLDEVIALCSRATVMRRGRVVAATDPRQETAGSLAAMMVGQELKPPVHRRPQHRAAARLEVQNLSAVPESPTAPGLTELSFTVSPGEILGIAGVAGNGQGELLAALSGEQPVADANAIRLDGQPIGRLGAGARRGLGLTFVPEDRLGHATVGEMDLTENAFLSAYGRMEMARGGWLHRGAAERYAAKVIDAFDVRTSGTDAAARSLSGGNLQKFVMGREILQAPTLFVCGQPTWGIDASAAQQIHQALFDLADAGAAVVIVSQDLDELFLLADRLAVLHVGRLSAPRRVADLDVTTVGLLMGGAHPEAAEVVDVAV